MVMEDHAYRRLSKADREAEDVRAAEELDNGLAAAHHTFYDRYVVATKAADKVATDPMAPPGAELKARKAAEIWGLRANAASGGKLRLTQDELGDSGFMKEHGALIHQATQAHRTEAGPSSQAADSPMAGIAADVIIPKHKGYWD